MFKPSSPYNQSFPKRYGKDLMFRGNEVVMKRTGLIFVEYSESQQNLEISFSFSLLLLKTGADGLAGA